MEDDEVEDDDVKGEKDDDLMLRRRKMIMLRMMRLRRKTVPRPGNTLCASLSGPNACPHVTRDITIPTLYGNLQAKCRGLGGAQNADTR